MNNPYLEDIMHRIEKVSEDVEAQFGTLSVSQLNWKPSPEEWSIGQCLHHLVTTNETYFPQLIAIISGTKKRSIWERLPFLPGFWGRMLVKSMTPEPKTKMKAPSVFRPSQSNITADIVSVFKTHNEELLSYFQSLDAVDHQKVIITSPAAYFVTYSLFNAIRILTNHEERHYQQAMRALERLRVEEQD